MEKKKIVEKCQGCERTKDDFCVAYRDPSYWWRLGICPLATHVRVTIKSDDGKKRAGQQKQKKKK